MYTGIVVVMWVMRSSQFSALHAHTQLSWELRRLCTQFSALSWECTHVSGSQIGHVTSLLLSVSCCSGKFGLPAGKWRARGAVMRARFFVPARRFFVPIGCPGSLDLAANLTHPAHVCPFCHPKSSLCLRHSFLRRCPRVKSRQIGFFPAWKSPNNKFWQLLSNWKTALKSNLYRQRWKVPLKLVLITN